MTDPIRMEGAKFEAESEKLRAKPNRWGGEKRQRVVRGTMNAALRWLCLSLTVIACAGIWRGGEPGIGLAKDCVGVLGALATGFYVAKSAQRQAQIGKGE